MTDKSQSPRRAPGSGGGEGEAALLPSLPAPGMWREGQGQPLSDPRPAPSAGMCRVFQCRDLPSSPRDVLITAQEEPEQTLTNPSGGAGSSGPATRSHLQMMNPTKAMTLAWGRAKGHAQPKGAGGGWR